MAAPRSIGATVRCTAICRPDRFGPTPTPMSAIRRRGSAAGEEASKTVKPRAPSATAPLATSRVPRNALRRAITAAPTLTAIRRPSRSG